MKPVPDSSEGNVRVSVVVVNYRTPEALARCLHALEPHHEVIVVDNASGDGSAEMVRERFPHVHLIANDHNRGFGPANNQGLELATGRYALFLNSDCVAEPGAIDLLADHMDTHSDAVACGGMLLHPDGRLQASSANRLTLWAVFCEQTLLEKAFPPGPLSPYWNTRVLARAAEPSPTAQVMGACLMVRPLERFDERFFLYCEDTELCRRLERRGSVWFVPQARFLHELGASSRSERWASVARYNRGKELYFAIHHGPAAQVACWAINRLGALIRLVGWGVPCLASLGLIPRLRRQVALFLRVLAAPLSGPKSPRDSGGNLGA